jgi:phage repressor protein C with HTH and peptisase S24 domain
MASESTKKDAIASRLQRLAQTLKVTRPSEFANKFNISRVYAGEVLSGKKGVGEQLLVALANENVNLSWLFTGEGNPLLGGGRRNLAGDTGPENAGLPSGVGEMAEFSLVPSYSTAFGAGDRRLTAPGAPTNRTPYRTDELKRLADPIDSLVELEVDGEAMVPTLYPGERVLVDTNPRRSLKDGIWAVRIGDGLLIKRLAVDPDGTIHILSDNAAYPARHLPRHETEGFAVVGKVLMVAKRV